MILEQSLVEDDVASTVVVGRNSSRAKVSSSVRLKNVIAEG